MKNFTRRFRQAIAACCGVDLGRVLLTLLAIFALILSTTATASPAVIELPVRPGVKLPILYFAPEGQARAAVVLLPGSDGRVGFYANGSMQRDQGFLNRNAPGFAVKGMAVVVVDTPSDHRDGLYGFRDSAEHATDVGEVIAWLREKTHVSVWLIGHSRGTESAVSVATRLGEPPRGPDGLVLTAPVLRAMSFPGRRGKALVEFDLDHLHVPTLVLINVADECSSSPPSELPTLRERLPDSLPRKAILTVSGGNAGKGSCDTESYHSFSGRDGEALETIAEFVLRQ